MEGAQRTKKGGEGRRGEGRREEMRGEEETEEGGRGREEMGVNQMADLSLSVGPRVLATMLY